MKTKQVKIFNVTNNQYLKKLSDKYIEYIQGGADYHTSCSAPILTMKKYSDTSTTGF